jgi:hypothetical protein
MENRTASAHASSRRILPARRRAALAFPWLLSIAACASTGAPPEPPRDGADRPCTRLEAAHGVTKKWLFEGIPKLQRKAIDDCGRGDLRACAAAPLATPYALVLTPVFPLAGFFASEANMKHHCS